MVQKLSEPLPFKLSLVRNRNYTCKQKAMWLNNVTGITLLQ